MPLKCAKNILRYREFQLTNLRKRVQCLNVQILNGHIDWDHCNQFMQLNDLGPLSMDKQDIRTLKILEEIELGKAPSQRDLARKLNISLGLVNSFIKRLVHKGYFKVTNLPANRVKYLLTPKGMTEKTRLTYEYIRYSFDFYRVARQKLRKIISEFVEQGGLRIIFWGVTDLAEIAYVSLQEFPVQLIGVVDGKYADGEMFGVPIIAKEKLTTLHFDKILITNIVSVEEAINEVLALGISKKQLLLFE